MKNNMLLMIVVAAIIGVASFFAGTKYQSMTQTTGNRQFAAGQFGQFGGSQGQTGTRNRIGMRQTIGEILSADDQSVTVKMMDGGTKIALLTSKTTISKATPGEKSDLKVGERVGIFGTDNSDGSLTAQNIQLNPMVRGLSGTPAPQQ